MRTRHYGLSVVAGVNAFAGWAGALGLGTGELALGAEIEERLPFDSPVFAGVALACIVAVPLSALAALAWRGDPKTFLAAALSGSLLMGWILIQLVVIRTVSFFHPLYFAFGAGLLAWGSRHRPARFEHGPRMVDRMQVAIESTAEAIAPLVNRPQGKRR